MLRGEDFWDGRAVAGLTEWTTAGRSVLSYDDLPPSPYRLLIRTAEAAPDAVAVTTEEGGAYTYARLVATADAAARRLVAWGVRRGTRVGLLLGSGIEFVAAFLGANSLGAVVVAAPTKFKEGDLIPLVDSAAVSYLICEARFGDWDFAGIDAAHRWVLPDDGGTGFDAQLAGDGHGDDVRHREAPPGDDLEPRGRARATGADGGRAGLPVAADPEDTALLLFTSGTTSVSKPVMIRNFNIAHAVETFARTLGLDASDSSVIATPIYTVTGIVGTLLLMFRVGGTVHLQRRIHAESYLAAVAEKRATFIHAAPVVLRMMLGARRPGQILPSVRMLVCGSAFCPESVILGLHALMPNLSFRTAYGMTETTSVGTLFPVDAGRAGPDERGSSGLPTPGLRVKICDGAGAEVPYGVPGEILLQGPGIAGYADASASAWLHTGDLGVVSPSGYLTLVGRLKDVINRGGEKIACGEVEKELQLVPGVADAALVGIPDEVFGEVPAAAIVIRDGADFDEAAARAILRRRIAHYKIPEIFVVFDALPMTQALKTDKKAIRKAVLASLHSPGHLASFAR